jgi:hypothetical protein
MCELWPFTLREQRGLRVFEIKMLRKFGPRHEKIAGGKKRQSDELHNLYSSRSIMATKSRVNGLDTWHVWEMRNVQNSLVGKPEGKRSLKRFRSNIRITVKRILTKIDLKA